VPDPGVARTKLAWWRQEIAQLFDGTPQHPVARALQPVVRDFPLPQAHFQTVIDGMAMDLDQARYVDFAALELYCHRVAGVVGLMSAEIFGYADPRTRDYARDLGIAFQLTNICRDVGEDARRGRIYLPQEDLARFGVAPSTLLRGEVAEPFRNLMAFEVQRAQQWYARAMAQLAAVDRKAQRTGLIMAAIYRTLLAEIARDGYRVLDRRTSLTPLRKLWIAWKTARAT
jgi:phytoene synthase